MTITWWIVELTATTALLAAIVALVCRLLPHRPAFHHLLWLIVLAKFLTPPWVAWHVPAPQWMAMPARLETAAILTEADETRIEPVPFLAEVGAAPTADAISALPPPAIEQASRAAEMPSLPTVDNPAAKMPETGPPAGARTWTRFATLANLGRMLAAIWLIGALVSSWRSARQIARYARLLRNPLPTPQDLTLEVGRLARQLGVRPVCIRVVNGVSSPFVWCLGRVTLVWPADMADPSNLDRWRGVMAHELAHVRRRDHWTVWLELLTGIIWWWHPVFWFTRRQLRQSAEAACDALAISALPAGRQAYAEAFLELSQLPLSGQPSPALGVGWRDATSKSFERRLAMILSEHVRSRVSLYGLAGVAMLALAALPGWSLRGAEPSAEETAQPSAQSEIIAADADPIPEPTAGNESNGEPSVKKISHLKLELAPGASAELTWSGEKIAGMRSGPSNVITVYPRSGSDDEHLITASEEGHATIDLSTRSGKSARIEVTVRAPKGSTAAAPSVPIVDDDPQPGGVPTVANPPDAVPLARRAVPQGSPRTSQMASSDGASPEPHPLQPAQIDVTNLGVAIIAAEGELKLSRLEFAYTEKLVGDKVVSNNELELARAKAQTAEQKVEFLKRLAQAACEAAQHELEYQRKAFERMKEMYDKKILSTTEFERVKQEYQAAKDKVALLETIPGVKATAAPEAPAKAD